MISDTTASSGFLVIDVGSSRVKLGWFQPSGECTSELKPSALPIAAPHLPQPSETLAVSHRGEADISGEIKAWLEQCVAAEPRCFVASVHPAAMAVVREIFPDQLQVLSAADLPIEVRVEHPERVGIDRLLNAVAVNRLRQPERPALVVDLGTACTVDLITAEGTFEGGAILPGVTLSAAALHTGTASLPLLEAESFDSPPPLVGKSTQAAISSGLYWGMVGAVRELVDRMSRKCTQTPQLFITGGGAPLLVAHLSVDKEPPRHSPHLVLAGIVLAANNLATEELS